MDAREILERRIDELCMENGRLRGQVASIIGRSFRTADKMYCLETENAKLRELVRDMWRELDAATQYDAGGGRGVVSEFADRMRELGILEEA